MKSPKEWVEDGVRDFAEDNDSLRAELKKMIGLPPLKEPKKIKPVFVRKPKTGLRRHFVIPDTQCRPGVDLSFLTWIGSYIRDHAKTGDVVVHLDDHWDFPSLSPYDKGKRCFEGRRYKLDVEAGNTGMDLLTKPYRSKKGLKVEEHLTIGNHTERLLRVLEVEPWLEGAIGLHDLNLSGWQVHEYRKPVEIDGVLYAHYFYAPLTGRAYGGSAATILKQVGKSFCQGHRQILDVATQQLPDGSRRRGVIAGASHPWPEDYLGPQADSHWRGMLVFNEVYQGDFDILEVSLGYLNRTYG